MVSVLICVLTLSALVACDSATEEGGGTETPSASATIVSSPRTVTMREPDWWTPPAAVERLFVGHSVVVGAVTGVERRFEPATRLYTVFAVRVEQTLRGENIAEGDTIYIAQTGGAWEGVDYEEKGNSLLREGGRYVLTVDSFSGNAADADFHGYYLSQPFAQFVLDSGAMEPKDGMWANLPAVAELTGRSLDDARNIIAGLAEPTPIAGEILLGALRDIPFPANAGQPSPGTINPDGPIGTGAFVANTTIDDVFAFYQEKLPAIGWLTETGPQVVSYPGKGVGGTGATTIGTWTLTKDDLRLLIATGQTPKDAPVGEIATQLIIEPVWFTGLEGYSVCALPSSISDLRPTSAVCGHP